MPFNWFEKNIEQDLRGFQMLTFVLVCFKYFESRKQLVHDEGKSRITQLRSNGKFRDQKGTKGSQHTLVIDLLEQV